MQPKHCDSFTDQGLQVKWKTVISEANTPQQAGRSSAQHLCVVYPQPFQVCQRDNNMEPGPKRFQEKTL